VHGLIEAHRIDQPAVAGPTLIGGHRRAFVSIASMEKGITARMRTSADLPVGWPSKMSKPIGVGSRSLVTISQHIARDDDSLDLPRDETAVSRLFAGRSRRLLLR
jgi:hypothetical protein